jgi:hypothetical protein
VKIYVGAMKALRKKAKQDETQFTTKIQDETQFTTKIQDETQFITKIDGFLSFKNPQGNANALFSQVFFESHPMYI